MICIYVAVGQKTSSVKRAIAALQSQGHFERCIMLVAGATSAAGREAYPGDVFYIHARLFERAAKLSAERGGGSLTALPIAETDSGNLSAYIQTNLISITDGQIVLDAALLHQGQKPTVDVDLSVSRVGDKMQAPSLRKAAGTLHLDYAQFLGLEVFTRFGGMPEGRVRDQLKRGERICAILRQPQHAPFRLVDEIDLMRAVQSGLLDPLPLEALADFRAGLPAALDRDAPEAVATLAPNSKASAGLAAHTSATLRATLTSARRSVMG